MRPTATLLSSNRSITGAGDSQIHKVCGQLLLNALYTLLDGSHSFALAARAQSAGKLSAGAELFFHAAEPAYNVRAPVSHRLLAPCDVTPDGTERRHTAVHVVGATIWTGEGRWVEAAVVP